MRQMPSSLASRLIVTLDPAVLKECEPEPGSIDPTPLRAVKTLAYEFPVFSGSSTWLEQIRAASDILQLCQTAFVHILLFR